MWRLSRGMVLCPDKILYDYGYTEPAAKSVCSSKLAVIPAYPARLHELERHALDGLLVDHLGDLRRELRRGRLTTRGCVASKDLMAKRSDRLKVSMNEHVTLEHDAA
jgi:hypothetical protein